MYTSIALIPLFLAGALSASSPRDYVPPLPSVPSKIEDFSGLVSLHNSSSIICAGSILDESHVLTTARCANDLKSPSTVRSESSFFMQGGKTHNIMNITTHPFYNPRTFDYDVAVLTVDSATPLNKSYSVQIANSTTTPRTYQQLSVYGWGNLQNNSTFFVEVLPFMDSSECNRFFTGSYSPAKLVTDRMLCTLIEPRYSKISNYGSPVMISRSSQIAISSWNRGRSEDIYIVHTDLLNDKIREFISNSTGISL